MQGADQESRSLMERRVQSLAEVLNSVYHYLGKQDEAKAKEDKAAKLAREKAAKAQAEKRARAKNSANSEPTAAKARTLSTAIKAAAAEATRAKAAAAAGSSGKPPKVVRSNEAGAVAAGGVAIAAQPLTLSTAVDPSAPIPPAAGSAATGTTGSPAGDGGEGDISSFAAGSSSVSGSSEPDGSRFGFGSGCGSDCGGDGDGDGIDVGGGTTEDGSGDNCYGLAGSIDSSSNFSADRLAGEAGTGMAIAIREEPGKSGGKEKADGDGEDRGEEGKKHDGEDDDADPDKNPRQGRKMGKEEREEEKFSDESTEEELSDLELEDDAATVCMKPPLKLLEDAAVVEALWTGKQSMMRRLVKRLEAVYQAKHIVATPPPAGGAGATGSGAESCGSSEEDDRDEDGESVASEDGDSSCGELLAKVCVCVCSDKFVLA